MADRTQPDTNPSRNATQARLGHTPHTEGAADKAPPAILKARGDLAVENRNYWQAEAERRAARIAELEAELQRRSGVQSREAIAAVIDPVAFHPISLGDTHPGWLHRREVALETAGKILALGPAQAPTESPLDLAWEAVNALGGTGNSTEELAYIQGIEAALSAIEELGGSDPLPKRSALSSADRGRDNG